MALLILFFAFVATLISPAISTSIHDQSAKNGFQSTLIHVDRDKRLTKTELLSLAGKRGKKRVQWLQSKIMAGPAAIETAVYDASGDYLMHLSIGTPTPSPVTAVMDTGSGLIWTQCHSCRPCINQSTPIFDPKKSLSYSKLKCSTNLCKALPPKASICNKGGYCDYSYSYGDGSSTRGALATETFTFEGKVKVPGIGFGCGLANKGDSLNSSGVVGLGPGGLSLVSQMNQSRFSYCLPTYGSDGTGVLTIGCRATNHPGVKVKATPLIKNPLWPYYYYLSLQGISIGRTHLPIDNSTFAIRKDGLGGLIIDSGTTLTYLEESAFDQVKRELTRQLGLNTTDKNDTGLDLCFNITSHDVKMVKFPSFVFHFLNGVNLNLRHKNYFITDSEEGVGCLAMEASSGFSILGNFQQQNTLVVHDLAKGRLSFLPNYNKM
ncbi:aspartic proteinase nepenthesin-1 [Phtheirospermum japonicum]|uniref:Aspartic proteinase nepenthesin-1 n=1 Tax=Phtheirospermum japonicum TaxID=374723 RepID=A0A830CZ53_9LAMI|nr:aspartic proteinase nepenthesin-1 [Phtheirospermum japonicum]